MFFVARASLLYGWSVSKFLVCVRVPASTAFFQSIAAFFLFFLFLLLPDWNVRMKTKPKVIILQ